MTAGWRNALRLLFQNIPLSLIDGVALLFFFFLRLLKSLQSFKLISVERKRGIKERGDLLRLLLKKKKITVMENKKEKKKKRSLEIIHGTCHGSEELLGCYSEATDTVFCDDGYI